MQLILLNFKFGQFVVVPIELLPAAVEKLDGILKYEFLTLTSPPVGSFDHSFRPRKLLDDSTYDYLPYREIKTLERILTVL